MTHIALEPMEPARADGIWMNIVSHHLGSKANKSYINKIKIVIILV
jgi:hypothetical protein